MQTMNMNRLLLTNIKASLYFRELSKKKTFSEVVDEIYYHGTCKTLLLAFSTPLFHLHSRPLYPFRS